MQNCFLARPCLWQQEGTWLCCAAAPAGLECWGRRGRNPGIVRNKWFGCFQSGPALWGYPFPAPEQSSPGGAELNWQVLQCLSLPGHVFNGWISVLVCTGNCPCAPGMDSSCFSHSHAGTEWVRESALCSLIYGKSQECPEREWKFRKLCEIPGTKILYPGKQLLSSALIFFPFGNPGVCCESWQSCSKTDNFHIPPVLSFEVFVGLFQEQEGVSHHCQGLHLAQLALWKYPCAVSSLARFFSISLNLNVARSDPIPAIKSCCDAPAISHLTAEAGMLSFPQLL